MASVLIGAADLAEKFDRAETAREVGRLLLHGLWSFGARTITASSNALPVAATVGAFIASRHMFLQQSPQAWIDAYKLGGLHDRNPVVFASARRATAFQWTDCGFDEYRSWAGFGVARDLGFRDGFTVPCHGPGGRYGVISFGFERIDLSPREKRIMALAASVAHERMMVLSPPPAVRVLVPSLTPRERDCLAFVAEGLSDGDIAGRLGIGSVTAHAHVENGKRKLGARTRAQAVAKLYAFGLI